MSSLLCGSLGFIFLIFNSWVLFFNKAIREVAILPKISTIFLISLDLGSAPVQASTHSLLPLANPRVWDTSNPSIASHHNPVLINLKNPSSFTVQDLYPFTSTTCYILKPVTDSTATARNPFCRDQPQKRSGSWIWDVWKAKWVHRHRLLMQADRLSAAGQVLLLFLFPELKTWVFYCKILHKELHSCHRFIIPWAKHFTRSTEHHHHTSPLPKPVPATIIILSWVNHQTASETFTSEADYLRFTEA